jgi:tetratricopeptide (TPR) repeat protein
MRERIFFIPMIVIWLLASTIGISQNLQNNKLLREVNEIVDAVAEVSFLKWRNDQNLIQSRMPQLYQTLSIKRSSVFEESLFIYRAESLKHLNRNKEAIEVANKRINMGINKPDFLVYLGGAEKPEDRIKAWNEHGRIVPISSMGSSRDSRLSGPVFVKIDPPPPSVPLNSIFITNDDKKEIPSILPGTYNIQDVLATIGDLYESSGFIEEALNVYLEAFYAMLFSDNPSQRGRLWLKIAEIEKKNGNKEWAVQAYLKAAHNWHEYAGESKKGIAIALAGDGLQEVVSTTPKLQKGTAISIAALYRKLNLHPLALAALEKSEQDTDEKLAEEKKEILEEWNEILEKLRQYYRLARLSEAKEVDFYVLGQKVSEVKDWAKISILRPTDTFWK